MSAVFSTLTASSNKLYMVGSWFGPVLMDVAMFSSSSTCSATGPAHKRPTAVQVQQVGRVCGTSRADSYKPLMLLLQAYPAKRCCVQSLPIHVQNLLCCCACAPHTSTSCCAVVCHTHSLTHKGLGNKVHAWQCLHQAGVLLVQRVPAHAQHFELREEGPLRRAASLLATVSAGLCRGRGVVAPCLPEVICHDACVAHDAVGLLLRDCCCGLLLLLLAVCGAVAACVQLLCAARRLRHRLLLLHAVAACMCCCGHPCTTSQRVDSCCWGQRQAGWAAARLWLWSGWGMHCRLVLQQPVHEVHVNVCLQSNGE